MFIIFLWWCCSKCSTPLLAVLFTPSLHDVQCVDHVHYHTLIVGSNKSAHCLVITQVLHPAPPTPFKHFNRSLQACKHMPCTSHFCSCFLSCLSLSCLSLCIKVHILGHLCALTVMPRFIP